MSNALFRSWLHIGEEAYRLPAGLIPVVEANEKIVMPSTPGYLTQYSNCRRNGYDPRNTPKLSISTTELRNCLSGEIRSIRATEKSVLVRQEKGWVLLRSDTLGILSQGALERGIACGAINENGFVWMDNALDIFDTGGRGTERVRLLLGRKRGFTDILPIGRRILITGFMAPPYIPDMADPYITYEIFNLDEVSEPDEDSKLRDAEKVGVIAFYGNRSCLPIFTDSDILLAAQNFIVLTNHALVPIRQAHLENEIIGISCSKDSSRLWCLATMGNRCDISVRDTADLHEVMIISDIGFFPVCPVLTGPDNELIVIGDRQMKAWSDEGKTIISDGFPTGNSGLVFASVMMHTLLVAAGECIYIWDCQTWERSILPLPSSATTPVVQSAPGTLLVGTRTGLYHVASDRGKLRATAQ